MGEDAPPKSSRLITEAERRFLVRCGIGVPSAGLGERVKMQLVGFGFIRHYSL